MGTHSWVNTVHLNTEVPSVNVVSQEEIPRSGGVAPDLKEFHQVVLAGRFRMCARVRAQGKKELTYCPWISPQTGTQVTRCQI